MPRLRGMIALMLRKIIRLELKKGRISCLHIAMLEYEVGILLQACNTAHHPLVPIESCSLFATSKRAKV